MSYGVALFFLVVLVYALTATRLNRVLISMPIFFVLAGALIGDFTPAFSFTLAGVGLLTEVTLALLLFADASSLSFRRLTEDNLLPDRLLLLGLPLSILLGALLAYAFFPGQGIWFAFLVAAILAPTDAALGLPIFNNSKVPVRIRRALNVESGLNDGIVTPFVALFLALTLAAEGGRPIEPFLGPALLEIAIAVVVAVVTGMGGGTLFRLAHKQAWSTAAAQQMGGLALALLAYSASVALGGNGFIAAFVAGLLFGWMARRHAHAVVEFTEVTGTLLSVAVWTIFGAAVVRALIVSFDWRSFVYALLALSVVRIAAVSLSTAGTGLRLDTTALMGWFGPRGLASVVFTIIALEAFGHAGESPHQLVTVAGWTILLSVVLHGLSAQPVANWYARRLAGAPDDIPERLDTPEVTIRRSHLTPKAGNIEPAAGGATGQAEA